MRIPRSDEDSKKFFRSIVPSDPRVSVRPMFGNESAFVNGNMFFGLFGNDLFVRLSEEDGQELIKKGGAILEPMKGRPMKGYVVLPKEWMNQPNTLDTWITRSLNWAAKLPQKKKSKK